MDPGPGSSGVDIARVEQFQKKKITTSHDMRQRPLVHVLQHTMYNSIKSRFQ
jgi:hypothetical protein